MNSEKMKKRLASERAQIVEAMNITEAKIAEGKTHIEKLNICFYQLQAKKAVYDKLLADKSLFDETENEISEVKDAEA
jgi:hypothetical protein